MPELKDGRRVSERNGKSDADVAAPAARDPVEIPTFPRQTDTRFARRVSDSSRSMPAAVPDSKTRWIR